MSKDIQRLIAEEQASSDSNPDAPITSSAHQSRPNQARSTVYSIRLNPGEVVAVRNLAEEAGLPASTLVRSWIVERVRAEQGDVSNAEAELRAAQLHLAQLQKHLSRHAS